MKIIILIFINLILSNNSYQAFSLPDNTYNLIVGKSSYNISKSIINERSLDYSYSTSFMAFPDQIQLTSFSYGRNFFQYHNYFNLNIINYGEFKDSETGYSFDSKDILFKNKLFKKVNHHLSLYLDINYLYSKIEQYKSNVISFNSSFIIRFKNFLIEPEIKNFGFILSDYTQYDQKLPFNYGMSLLYKPKYLNSLILVKHSWFSDFEITNFSGEIFLNSSLSLFIGYSSTANKLYLENNFEKNFFTGLSSGFNIAYKSFKIDFGVKNLGTTGTIQSFTITKRLN